MTRWFGCKSDAQVARVVRTAPRYIVSVPRLQRKGFGGPDEVRRFPDGIVEIVTLDDIAVSRFVFQPGWTCSKDIAPGERDEVGAGVRSGRRVEEATLGPLWAIGEKIAGATIGAVRPDVGSVAAAGR